MPASDGNERIKDRNPMMKTQSTLRQRRDNIGGYLFLLPLIIIFFGILSYSIVFLIKNSFFNVTISFKHPEAVGLNNYLTVLKDSQFYRSLGNTFLLASAHIFFGLTFGFLIAVFLSFSIRWKKFFHALFFIPSMLPVALMAAVFNSMLQYKDGTVNTLLRTMGLEFLAQRWLADPQYAMFSVMSVCLFLIAIPIMYYTADLSMVNSSVMEAAVIDGANLRQTLLMILFPIFRNTHKTIILSMILGGFRAMDIVFLMTDGGPGGATEIMGTYIYRASRSPGANLGRVCATAVLVLIISFSIGYYQMRSNRTQRS
jgi:ABC-type sugar transport system permease subunit